jgi:hypothetical protein
MLNEVDDVSNDNLEAVSAYSQRLLKDALPYHQAERIALEQFGVV